MKLIIKYWYLVLISVILNAGAGIGALIVRKDAWLPQPVDTTEDKSSKSEIASMSDEYLEWNYGVMQLEDMQAKLEEERASIDEERVELDLLRQQVEMEVNELEELRKEIDALRASVNDEFYLIEASEEENLKRLAKVYAEMKPVPVVELFENMDLELVVKIMSVISEDAAAKIFSEMTRQDQNPAILRRAIQITEKLRQIRK